MVMGTSEGFTGKNQILVMGEGIDIRLDCKARRRFW